AHIVGLSTGTGKATAVAAFHPDRVKKLVLAAPWTHGDELLTLVQSIRIAAAEAMPSKLYCHLNALLLYPPRYRRDHASKFNAAADSASLTRIDAANLKARLEAILSFDARPLYPLVTSPTLVLAAQDDLVMSSWFAESAATLLPNSRLVIFEDGGHMFPETKADEFVSLVSSFLA